MPKSNGCNIDVVFAGKNTTLMLLKLSLISSGWHPDKFAVAVKLEGRAVGHLPFNVALTVSHFLNRSINKGTVEVILESKLTFHHHEESV